jgi:hypothetical protein
MATTEYIHIDIGDLQPGDKVPHFGTVRAIRAVGKYNRSSLVSFHEIGDQTWPATGQVWVDRPTPLFRRTIVVESSNRDHPAMRDSFLPALNEGDVIIIDTIKEVEA